MVEIAVLRPQDPLKDRLKYNRHNSFVNLNFPPSKSKKSSFSNPSRGSDKSNRRKRSPKKNSRNTNTSTGGGGSLSSSPPAKNGHLVMGQVKILKRGEALTVPLKDGLEKKMEENGKMDTESFKSVLEKNMEEENDFVGTVSLKDDLVKKTAENREANCCTGRLENDDLALSTTARLGPEPDMVPKQIKIADFYAGSAFVSSPPPSSLPLPAFFKKKSVLAESYHDASSDLRRLLRLDLS